MIDISGQAFGRLVAIRRDKSGRGDGFWLCRCECGEEVSIRTHALRIGNTKSCGCLQRELVRQVGYDNRRHGMSKTWLHNLWTDMRNRCQNANNHAFADYGGRGIRVYPAWNESFERFASDIKETIGNRPSAKHSLDRIDNNGNYEPGNVRWATKKQQSQNTRSCRHITFRGETKTLSEWSRITGVPSTTIGKRLDLGWPVEKAFKSGSQHEVQVEFMGRTQSIRQWADETGIKYSTLHARIMRMGWSPERAIMDGIHYRGQK